MGCYGGCLQLIQTTFSQRETLPAQAVEKIVQAIARGDLPSFENEVFVGLAFGQGRLRDELTDVTSSGHVQRLCQALLLQDMVGGDLTEFTPRRKPRLSPINLG